jgi:hypothetical protein
MRDHLPPSRDGQCTQCYLCENETDHNACLPCGFVRNHGGPHHGDAARNRGIMCSDSKNSASVQVVSAETLAALQKQRAGHGGYHQ